MTSIPRAFRFLASLMLGCAVLGAVACQGSSGTPDRMTDRCFVLVASVAPGEPVLAPSDSVHLTATYNAVAAECLPSVPASSLVWRSVTPAIASVDSVRGEVTAHTEGVVQVSAYAPGGSAVLGSTFVKVTAP